MDYTHIVIGSDHGGFLLKEYLAEHLSDRGYIITDVGCHGIVSVDYPEYAIKCCRKVLEEKKNIGILLCGSGIGMSITANKLEGIRAALCTSEYHARMARKHNDANVLCIGARVTAAEYAAEIAYVFLNTSFDGGRHKERLEKVSEIETKRGKYCI